MEKAKITQEQADKIWGWEWHTGGKSKLLGLHAKNLLGDSKCLQSLTLDELARAIYVGCEVEENDWVVRMDHEIEEPYKVIGRTDEGHIQIDDESASLLPSSVFRYATTQEIAAEKEHRMDSKLDRIWIGLSDYERNGFYRKLVRGDY